MDISVLDKVPGYNLYIGGFIALRRPKALKNCNITHIVSVIDWKFEDESPLIRDYKHLHIPVDDVEDENLLEWFPQSNAFIEEGLKPFTHGHDKDISDGLHAAESEPDSPSQGGSVFIHCAMGKSRSSTVLLAYLLWSTHRRANSSKLVDTHAESVTIPSKPLDVINALMLLRRGRATAEPNEGFMEQLYMYYDMGCPTTLPEIKSHKLYRRWMNKRAVKESLAINQAPELSDVLFEDESLSPNAEEEIAPGVKAPSGMSAKVTPSRIVDQQLNLEIKCRKCRRTLAKSAFINPHNPSRSDPGLGADHDCAHIFLHPLGWMKESLSAGQLDGRLTCPNTRCGVNIGKYAWQGLRCSCGGWVTPAFALSRSRVDEIQRQPTSTTTVGQSISDEGGGAVRLPPSMRKGSL